MHGPGLFGAEVEARCRLVDPVLPPVLGDVAALGIDQDVLQDDPSRRILDHDHRLVAAGALRRCALVAGLQQHGFVEGEIDRVLALHREDRLAVGGDVGGRRSMRDAGDRQQADGDPVRHAMGTARVMEHVHACNLVLKAGVIGQPASWSGGRVE